MRGSYLHLSTYPQDRVDHNQVFAGRQITQKYLKYPINSKPFFFLQIDKLQKRAKNVRLPQFIFSTDKTALPVRFVIFL